MKALTKIATLAARAIPGGRVLALLLAAMMAGLLVAVAKDAMARPAPVPLPTTRCPCMRNTSGTTPASPCRAAPWLP